MNKLIFATRNRDKVRELNQLIGKLDIKLYSALDFEDLEEVVEDLPDLEGNALKKARYVHKMTGIPALSDDTGLEVDALGGAPGVYSARYAGENASYQDNVIKLINQLEGKSNRAAQFRTVVALVNGNEEYIFEGLCKGTILSGPRGEKGFGYDPVFQPVGFDHTFAELPAETKNEISHRGKAIDKVIQFLS